MDKIIKNFEFKNFSEALDFINKVGELAEQANHHPDIFLYDYKKVRLTLTTHSEGGVTQKDRELARQIDKLL